jgi:hypothetical protein
MIDRITCFLSFTSGFPVLGNLTDMYTLLSTKHGTQNYFNRPAIETTQRFVSYLFLTLNQNDNNENFCFDSLTAILNFVDRCLKYSINYLKANR